MAVQRDQRWLDAATPEEIAAAQKVGELARLLGAEVNQPGDPARVEGE